jgi:ketosteroid isomerase-like protein
VRTQTLRRIGGWRRYAATSPSGRECSRTSIFRAEELIDAGDKVLAWIRFSGKGITSGTPVEMEQAQIWTFRDGKVVRVEEYFDRHKALEAAGLKE